jgi:hypothetical protein
MIINSNKTKAIVVTKAKEIPVVKLKVNNILTEQVQQFKYLGSTITSDGKCSIDIRQRIAMAKRVYTQKLQLLTNKNLNINMRKNFAKCYVWSVLLYGCGTWTIIGQEKKKLEAMEMWIWKRLLKISWT